MKDKYGFKTYGNNGLENYKSNMAESRVVANAHRYLPKHKKVAPNTSVTDLFKDSRTAAQKQEDALKEQLRSLQNTKVPKEMLMSAEEKQLLGNANQLDMLFNSNRFAFVSSLDNQQCKQIERKYSNKGVYFVNMKNESIFFNKVSLIQKLEYVPGNVFRQYNHLTGFSAYDVCYKHADGTNVVVARLVFAN